MKIRSVQWPRFLVFMVAYAGALLAGDWRQYRGPNVDGISVEPIQTRWSATGPNQVWKANLDNGFSSFAVADGRAFTLVSRQVDGADREVVIAINADTGKELWSAPLGVAKYDDGGDSGTRDNKGGDGPRSTPAVDGDRVYTLDNRLKLTCLDVNSGKIVWTKDLVKEHGAKLISWQSAASPIVEGNLVFVCGGGEGQSLLGINKKDGAVVWKVESDKATHATPVPATIHNLRQIIFFTQRGLVSVLPESGRVLWRYPFRYNVSAAASPVVAGDIVYCSAGYGVGAGAARIARSGDTFTAREIWRKTGDEPLANHWSTPVVKDGHLYGMFSFKKYGTGPLKCVEVATGNVKWTQAGFGPGNVLLAGGQVLALSDDGQIVAVEASPSGYKEIARAKVLNGKCWSTPALSNGRVYARSTREGVCLDLSVKAALN